MATMDKFEDHCWKDVIPADDLKLYAPYARETYVGPDVAFLAIDLYNASGTTDVIVDVVGWYG